MKSKLEHMENNLKSQIKREFTGFNDNRIEQISDVTNFINQVENTAEIEENFIVNGSSRKYRRRRKK